MAAAPIISGCIISLVVVAAVAADLRHHEPLQHEPGVGADLDRGPCVVQDANMGHQLAGGNSSWCPDLKCRTTHR